MKEWEAQKDTTKQISNYVPRYKSKMNKKRQWEESEQNGIKKTKEKDDNPPFERIKRKKSVILLGYCGAKYFGMQRNPAMETIEEELLKAMKQSNWITEEAFNQPQTIAFQRAARTDKGNPKLCLIFLTFKPGSLTSSKPFTFALNLKVAMNRI